MQSRTLVATFDDYSTARQAARELEDFGVPADAIHINSNQQTAGAGSSESYGNAQQHESGFAGWWHSLFGSENDNTDRAEYEGAIAGGSTVLSATVPGESVDPAIEVLNRYGNVESGQTSRTLTDSSTTSGTTAGTRARAGDGPIQVVDEELQVGKRAVQRGGVRVYSHLVSTPVQEQVTLREEHVSVERRPVNREISPAEVSALRDQTIEVTEMAEEAVIGKRARVREEVVVGKQETERTETIRDNVRHTEVEVEQLGTQNQSSSRSGLEDYTSDYRTNFEQNYAPSGANFETMRPAYEYGYQTASDPSYSGRSWGDVETNLRSNYESRNPGSSWEKAKDAVRYGWEKVTGNR